MLLCSHYVADLIKKLEFCLMVVSDLLKIKFGHAQISVSKIGIPMSKTACISPSYCKRPFSFQLFTERLIFLHGKNGFGFFFYLDFQRKSGREFGGVGWGRTFIPDSKVLFRPNSLIWETN